MCADNEGPFETALLTLCILETHEKGTFANGEDPDEVTHQAAFHQGLHFLLMSK